MTAMFRGAPRLVLALLFASACGRGGAKEADKGGAGQARRRPSKFPVEVARVEAAPVEFAVNAVGSVAAFETVQVTARVTGAVERVRFAEGDRVKVGQPLVEIEPRRHRLAVEAARAALEKARASEADAKAGLERREGAVSTAPGLIPKEEIATWRTRLLTTAADVAEARAALAEAELNLRDAYVRAPIAGIIETRTVETGQYVQPGAVMGTLVRREPLLLRFNVPAPEAAALRTGLPVRFQVRGSTGTHEGRITHVSAAAERTSRMVAVTAQITDAERADLRPGAFAEVTVPVGGTRTMPVIVQTAVRPTERGFVSYVVEGGVVRERPVTLGLRTPDGRIQVVEGVKAGDLVVVRGAEALRDGAAVEVARAAAPEAAAAEAPAGGAAAGDARRLHP